MRFLTDNNIKSTQREVKTMFIDEVGSSEQVSKIYKASGMKLDRKDKVSSKKDTVEVSSSSFQKKLNDSLSSVPETRDSLISDIAEKIKNGSYQISAQNIADKMVESSEHDDLRSELFG